MAWLDPNPGPTGCRCAQCYGLAEYMADHGREDHGLPRSPQYLHRLIVRQGKPEPPPVKRHVAAQPWEPRPSRRSI